MTNLHLECLATYRNNTEPLGTKNSILSVILFRSGVSLAPHQRVWPFLVTMCSTQLEKVQTSLHFALYGSKVYIAYHYSTCI